MRQFKFFLFIALMVFSSASTARLVEWHFQDAYLEKIYEDSRYEPLSERLQIVGSFVYEANAPYDWCGQEELGNDCDTQDDYDQRGYRGLDIRLVNDDGETVFNPKEIFYTDRFVCYLTPCNVMSTANRISFGCMPAGRYCQGAGAPDDYIFDTMAVSLNFGESLTNAGGTINLLSNSLGLEDLQMFEVFFPLGLPEAEYRLVSGTITAVPIPAAVWLFGSALVGLGWLRRRH